MKLTKCLQGHFYDADKYGECPYCMGDAASPGGNMGSNANMGMGQNGNMGPNGNMGYNGNGVPNGQMGQHASRRSEPHIRANTDMEMTQGGIPGYEVPQSPQMQQVPQNLQRQQAPQNLQRQQAPQNPQRQQTPQMERTVADIRPAQAQQAPAAEIGLGQAALRSAGRVLERGAQFLLDERPNAKKRSSGNGLHANDGGANYGGADRNAAYGRGDGAQQAVQERTIGYLDQGRQAPNGAQPAPGGQGHAAPGQAFATHPNQGNPSANRNFAPEDRVRPVVGWVVCVEGSCYGKSYDLHSGKNFIGRMPDMDICLEGDSHVSRSKHAIVVYDPKGKTFYLQSGESHELCYLNDKLILSEETLSDRDVIQVGESKLVFVQFCDETYRWEKDENGTRQQDGN